MAIWIHRARTFCTNAVACPEVQVDLGPQPRGFSVGRKTDAGRRRAKWESRAVESKVFTV